MRLSKGYRTLSPASNAAQTPTLSYNSETSLSLLRLLAIVLFIGTQAHVLCTESVEQKAASASTNLKIGENSTFLFDDYNKTKTTLSTAEYLSATRATLYAFSSQSQDHSQMPVKASSSSLSAIPTKKSRDKKPMETPGGFDTSSSPLIKKLTDITWRSGTTDQLPTVTMPTTSFASLKVDRSTIKQPIDSTRTRNHWTAGFARVTERPRTKHHHEHHWGPFFEEPLSSAASGDNLISAVHLFTEAVLNCRVGMLKDKTGDGISTRLLENVRKENQTKAGHNGKKVATYNLTSHVSKTFRFPYKTLKYKNETPKIYLKEQISPKLNLNKNVLIMTYKELLGTSKNALMLSNDEKSKGLIQENYIFNKRLFLITDEFLSTKIVQPLDLNVLNKINKRLKDLKKKYILQKVMWVRRTAEKVSLLTVGNVTYSGDPRIRVKFQYPNNWRLLINPTQTEDAGVYMCQVSTHPPRVFTTNLTILEPPLRIIDEHERDVGDRYYKSGSTVDLQCQISRSFFQKERHTILKSTDYVNDSLQKLFNDTTSELYLIGNTSRTQHKFSGQDLEKYFLKFITWAKDEEPLQGLTNTRLSVSDVWLTSRISIGEAKLSDSGNYSCSLGRLFTVIVQVQVLTGELPAAVQHNIASRLDDICSLAPLTLLIGLHFLSNFLQTERR
ncbi:uncharacterized protein LOC108134983 isoform X2 [Drosophila elegans]|uniref:uncharacterized protein LOC108134983 isoform X2 n=1 Tax=Drosophila elegans TaxID=30023 RepID=UPI001BC83AA7|nr:uncharacterized protein LOC108134983 isoform X2 [Drosophila elegans]